MPYTTTGRVKAWLKLDADDGADDNLVGAAVTAVNAWVADLPKAPPAGEVNPDDPDGPHGGIVLGATMLASRWYRRRNTPGGIDSVTDVGAVYVPRRDSDVDALLGLGPYAPPGLG